MLLFSRLQDTAAPEPPLESVTQTDTSFVWVPNVPAGTSVSLELNDSGGSLAQNSSFNVQKGVDTSCVEEPPSATSNATFVSSPPITSLTSSDTSSSLSPTASSSVSGPKTSSLSPASSPSAPTFSPLSGSNTPNTSLEGSEGVIMAIVAPICAFLVLALLFLFLWLRKRRRRVSLFEVLENSDQDLPPVSLNLAHEPFSQYPLPTRAEVTPEELQNAIDRIQEMYAIMQSSSLDNGRMLELRRQIEDLVADNAVLSGEQPPEYDAERVD